MQVKKFEAPTIQEALENVKRELGPEAIILQTKKNKRGFGLMSKASVEITAAISDRSMQKKQLIETRMPEPNKNAIQKMSAEKQADYLDKYMDKHLQKAVQTTERVEVSQSKGKKITATRYIDIDDSVAAPTQSSRLANQPLKAPTTQAYPKQNIAPDILNSANKTRPPTDFVKSNIPIEDEVRYLKRMIEELKTAQENAEDFKLGARGGAFQQTILDSPALQDVFEQLLMSGLDRRYAFSIVKKVAFELGPDGSKRPEHVLDEIAAELMDSLEVRSPLAQLKREREQKSGPSLIALIGPTGVGKTTTLAKLASDAILKQGLKVGLINLDNYKLTAFDQLATYAKILNVPFRSAASIEDLKAALSDFNSLDLILVDTTGRSQRDPDSLKEMHDILKSIPELNTYIVLSATTRDSELYDAAARFSVFRPQGMIMSKLDEATVYGGIYNVSQKVKLPLLYFTTGQKIPDDIEEASKERVAALILDL